MYLKFLNGRSKKVLVRPGTVFKVTERVDVAPAPFLTYSHSREYINSFCVENRKNPQ